jgi:energy-coupling factor transporter ATP-binding protein EcfA2
MTSSDRVLVLGGPDSGKSTYLLQLYGRVFDGEGRVQLRGAVDSMVAIKEGLARLASGRPAGHTPNGTETSLTLPLVDKETGREWDITVPDYAGEDLRRVGDALRLPDRWRDLAATSDHWVVMVRLSLYPDMPDLVSRPVGEVASASRERSDDGDVQRLPIDMFLVDLLQLLRHGRTQLEVTNDLHVTIVLSCWDELGHADDTRPSQVVRDQLALLDSYCTTTFGPRYRVLGLSAQGRALSDDDPAVEFIDEGPGAMGWLVCEDGARDPDLTKLIALV